MNPVVDTFCCFSAVQPSVNPVVNTFCCFSAVQPSVNPVVITFCCFSAVQPSMDTAHAASAVPMTLTATEKKKLQWAQERGKSYVI